MLDRRDPAPGERILIAEISPMKEFIGSPTCNKVAERSGKSAGIPVEKERPRERLRIGN